MRLRFTIRDLLWLTALVAVLVAWWIDHREMKYNSIEEWRKRAAELVKEDEEKAYAQSIGRFDRLNTEAAKRAALERQEQAKASR